MRKAGLFFILVLSISLPGYAQIDLDQIDLHDLIGKVLKVEKGFEPKFYLGNTPVQKIEKVAEILGLKKNEDVNRLFRTYRTGRTVYKVAAIGGGAIAAWGVVRKLSSNTPQNWEGALYSGLGAAGAGVIIKLLTRKAAYEAVDLFNQTAIRKVIDIFSMAPASQGAGIALIVKL